jgi:hypothetical protein
MTRKSHFAAHTAAPGGKLKKLLAVALVGAFVGAFVAAAPAHAGVIDFEGYFGPVEGATSIQQDGYNIGFYADAADGGAGALVGNFFDGTDPSACVNMACPVNNPGTYYGALNDSFIDITSSTAGAQFKIKSFDASFIGASDNLNSYPAVAGLLRVVGIRADGSWAARNFLLGGPTANGFVFGHYDAPTAFADLAFAEAQVYGYTCDITGSCKAFQTNQGQFAIDNISTAEVPEPGTDLMIGVGLFGLMACLRRRQA